MAEGQIVCVVSRACGASLFYEDRLSRPKDDGPSIMLEDPLWV